MVNLDELEAKARAAKEARAALDGYNVATPPGKSKHEFTDEFWRLARETNLAEGVLKDALEEESYLADTVLHLIERARALEGLRAFARHHPLCGGYEMTDPCDCGFEAAKARWESLAHSPQEA